MRLNELHGPAPAQGGTQQYPDVWSDIVCNMVSHLGHERPITQQDTAVCHPTIIKMFDTMGIR
jgi:hypothetical protein